jgi:hypothetical protein
MSSRRRWEAFKPVTICYKGKRKCLPSGYKYYQYLFKSMIEKELRKTKRVGGNLMITLPTSWCKERGIVAGDLIRVRESEDTLILIKEVAA